MQPYLANLEIDHQINMIDKAKQIMCGDINHERTVIQYIIYRVEVADKKVKICLVRIASSPV